MPPNVRGIIGFVRRRWSGRRRRDAVAHQVSVRVDELPPGSTPPRKTFIHVSDHSVPDLRTSAPQAALRITQKPQFLVPWSFDDRVISKLEQASVEKGRRLYCLDMRRDISDQVIAALSFHVDADEDRPLQLMALALRLDDPDLNAQSYVAAWYLLQYVSIAGEKLGRGGQIEFATPSVEDTLVDLAPLGFRELAPSPFQWPQKAVCLRP